MVCFYIAQYPVHWINQRALHFTSLHTLADRFIPTQIWLLCKTFRHAAIAQRLFTHISTAVCTQVLIHTAEGTGASWRERKLQSFETVPKRDSNPGSLYCESGVLLLSYRASIHIKPVSLTLHVLIEKSTPIYLLLRFTVKPQFNKLH